MNCAIRPTKLRDRVRHIIRTRRYSRRTEKSNWLWTRQFIRFHDMRRSSTLGVNTFEGY